MSQYSAYLKHWTVLNRCASATVTDLTEKSDMADCRGGGFSLDRPFTGPPGRAAKKIRLRKHGTPGSLDQ